jgi:hypothetical protein
MVLLATRAACATASTVAAPECPGLLHDPVGEGSGDSVASGVGTGAHAEDRGDARRAGEREVRLAGWCAVEAGEPATAVDSLVEQVAVEPAYVLAVGLVELPVRENQVLVGLELLLVDGLAEFDAGRIVVGRRLPCVEVQGHAGRGFDRLQAVRREQVAQVVGPSGGMVEPEEVGAGCRIAIDDAGDDLVGALVDGGADDAVVGQLAQRRLEAEYAVLVDEAGAWPVPEERPVGDERLFDVLDVPGVVDGEVVPGGGHGAPPGACRRLWLPWKTLWGSHAVLIWTSRS